MKVMLSWFHVDDAEKSKKFYSEVLGLEKIFEMQGWTEFSHAKGSAAIGLSTNSARSRQEGATVVLQVEEIERERKRLESRGVQFEGKTDEVPGVVKIATFRDPSGNRLQLAQVLMQQA